MNNELTSWIYVIGAYETLNFVKIGATTHLPHHGRLQQLQTGSPHKLHVHGFHPVQTEKLLAAEKRTHARLEANKMVGEWFNISPRKALLIVRDVTEQFYGKKLARCSKKFAPFLYAVHGPTEKEMENAE